MDMGAEGLIAHLEISDQRTGRNGRHAKREGDHKKAKGEIGKMGNGTL